jgi:carbamate kinase
MLNYGRSDQKLLRMMSAKEGRRYLEEGQFPPGSMGPKVEAALRFVESGGKKSVITSLESVEDSLEERAGTTVTAF